MAIQPKTEENGAEAGYRPDAYHGAVEAEGDLRPKNQLTVPKPVVDAMGLRPGDRLIFVVDEEDATHARLYRVPKSFAGIAPHAYGGPGGAKRYLKGAREGWDD